MRVWTAEILPALVAMRMSRWRGATNSVGRVGARMAMSSRAWVTRMAMAVLVDMVGKWMLEQMEAVRMMRPMMAMATWCCSGCWRGRASTEASMAARLPMRWEYWSRLSGIWTWE